MKLVKSERAHMWPTFVALSWMYANRKVAQQHWPGFIAEILVSKREFFYFSSSELNRRHLFRLIVWLALASWNFDLKLVIKHILIFHHPAIDPIDIATFCLHLPGRDWWIFRTNAIAKMTACMFGIGPVMKVLIRKYVIVRETQKYLAASHL